MTFNQIIRDIKNLKIQGAENIAVTAAKALSEHAQCSKTRKTKDFISDINHARELLFKSRPTEPCMRNAINYILNNLEGEDIEHVKGVFYLNVKSCLDHFKESKSNIVKIGANKIKNGTVVFTHCHSSTVTKILIEAKRQGKRFEVHNTETRPRFQGRITAAELAKAKIPVTHYVDSAAKLALKRADIMLIGADAVTAEGKVINKIGSELFSLAALHYDVPVYACTDSWKFDPLTVFGFEEPIEMRSTAEVWKDAPKGVVIDNHAFEMIDPRLITGIISELGIFSPFLFVEEIKRNNKWMFERLLL